MVHLIFSRLFHNQTNYYKFFIQLGLVSVLLLVAVALNAQHRQTDLIAVDPHVKIGKLPNGLTYYIRHNNKPENKAELRLVVNAGSMLEDEDQLGLAHFTEHMAFNGSKNFKKNELVSFLQSIGVQFGADLNAYTSFDETVYILPIPTDNNTMLDKGLQILEDWASTVTFDKTEIENERGVVLEEMRLRKGANDRIAQTTLPGIFSNSRYAERLPIGTEKVLKNFKPETIKRFYKDWYRPDLMAIMIVGDVDILEAEKLIITHFAKLKNPARAKERTYARIMPRQKSEGLVATDKEATSAAIELHYSSMPVDTDNTIASYRASMVKRLVLSMLNQRLQEIALNPNAPFLNAGNSFGGLVRGYESYTIRATLGNGGYIPAIMSVVQENERARMFGFTTPELDRTKRMLMTGIEHSYQERDKMTSAQLVSEYIRNFLEGEAIPGIENEYQYYKQFLEEITLEEIDQAALSIIPSVDEPKLIIYTGPDKPEFQTPSPEALVAATKSVSITKLQPYEEKRVAAVLLETIPAPGAITAEKKNDKLGTTELLLSNGVRVILKPTEFKNDEVIMSGSRPGGYHQFDVKQKTSAEYTSTVISQMGVGKFSPTELRKLLAGKSAGVSLRINATSETVSGGSSAADIETMLQLTYLNFTQPRLDTALFNSFVSRQQTVYRNAAASPQFVFQDSLFLYLYGKQPWAPEIPNSSTFTEIDVTQVIDNHQQVFGNANGFVFVIVGSFSIEQIKPLLAKYLASLPSAKPTTGAKDVGLRPATGLLKKEINRGKEQKSTALLMWNGEAPYTADESFRLNALMDITNIRLTESLREELAGAYSPSISGSLSKQPYGNYSITLNISCAPENTNKLISAALTEIDKIRSNGAIASDLNKVKETLKQQYRVNLKTNSYWVRYILMSLELGFETERVLTYEQRVDELTSNDIKNAANKYLNTKKFVQVVLNPDK